MTLIDEHIDMTKVSMADVALTFPGALEILTKYNLDFCCGGKKPFREVCQKSGVDADEVWQEIMQARATRGMDNRMNFNLWDLSLLVDFILQHHHRYVRNSIPQITELLDKVCSVHGSDTPVLFSIREDFSALAEELMAHMPKEEGILFPAIRKIVDQAKANMNVTAAQSHLKVIIGVMEHEHERAGDLIKSIRSLTENYTPPGYACPTFAMTYVMLKEFDNDLMQHIHVENNVLFPKAVGDVLTRTDAQPWS
jgi:regulator of cell morphogenesis and NO signaling